MEDLLIDFILLLIGATVVPIWIIIVLLLLRGQGGRPRALAFVGGILTVRLAQGIVFGYIFGASDNSETAGPSPVANTLLMVLGILLWVTALKKWRTAPDPNAPPPKWMTVFSDISTPKAFGMGALVVAISAKQWVFTLGALKVIRDAALGSTGATIAFLIFAAVSVSLLLSLIVFSVLAPSQSAKTLGTAGKWLETNNRAIVIAISVIFGTLFLYKGITGFLG